MERKENLAAHWGGPGKVLEEQEEDPFLSLPASTAQSHTRPKEGAGEGQQTG